MAEYAGGVFCDAIEGGRAGATLEVLTDGVRARTSDGSSFSVRANQCELELGGASGRMWFLRERTGGVTLYSEVPGFADALARVPDWERAVARILEERRRSRRRGSAYGIAAAMVLLAVGIGGFYAVKAAGRAALLALPTTIDERLGNLAMASMTLDGRVVDDERVVAAVDRIVERLAGVADGEFDYQVRVVDADVVNAFALPGGQIVVYTGLIREAASADAVAGVLAHEIAHVTERHGIQRIGQSLGMAAAVQLLLGDVGGVSALVIDLVQRGALTSYGRDHEREADREGVRMMLAAGLDPLGLVQIFEHFAEEQGESSLPVSWLSSHPEPRERIERIQAMIEQAPANERRPLPLDFAALRDHLGFEPSVPASGEAPSPVDEPVETEEE